ncbi:hypothetical protein [Bacillus cereus]|uniref:hypothetical protein n=1 Tax=Bacillus cereus group TaxID=86661 RepID=UPI000279DF54|nr:hypothetical protein [Bacillus cereus]EJR80238.1 hypothetical protein IKA_05670 [Bacillus cereus VD169]
MNLKSISKCLATTVVLSQFMAPNVLQAQTMNNYENISNEIVSQENGVDKSEKKVDGITEEYIKEAHSFVKVDSRFSSEGDYSSAFMTAIHLNANKPIEWTYKGFINGQEMEISTQQDENGSVKIVLESHPIVSTYVEIYAIKEGLNPVKVAGNELYSIEGALKFKNAGESGEIEPLGNINLLVEGQTTPVFLWKEHQTFRLKYYTQDKPYAFSKTFRSFKPIDGKTDIKLSANVKEQDYGLNPDDTLAFGDNDIRHIKDTTGYVTFTGDDSNGDSVNISYHITKK